MKFSDFIELHRGYDLPKTKRNADGLVPVIAAGGYDGFHDTAKVQGPGVITGRSGTLGSVYFNTTDFWPLNTTLFVSNFKGNDPLFVYYYLKTMDLGQYATGTTVPTLNRNHLNQIEVNIPDLAQQQEIANKLNLFDKKISTLNDINDNLLDLGITYTEELLVENEYPVSTIKSMNLTVSDHVANGSFKALKDNVEIVENSGYALFLRNTDLKADLNGDRRFVTENSYEFLKKSRLFGGEVIISNVGDVGSVYHVPYLDVPMVAGNNVVFLQSEESWLTDYLYFYFKSRIGQHDIDSITSGSAQQKFNKTDFRALGIPVITEHDVTILTKLIDNLNSNTREIRTLMDTRDALLKKLLN